MEKVKVEFLKDHVNGIKKGDIGTLSKGRANYVVRVGAAKYVTYSPVVTEEKPVKQKTKKTPKKEPCKTC